MNNRVGPALWSCIVLGSVIFIAGRAARGAAVDTSLLSLLPAAEGDPLLTEASALLSQRASHWLAVVVGHPDAPTAADMGRRLKEELKASAFVRTSLTELSPEQQTAFYELYFPFRYQMLSPDDRQRLQVKEPLDYFAARLTGALYSPVSSFL